MSGKWLINAFLKTSHICVCNLKLCLEKKKVWNGTLHFPAESGFLYYSIFVGMLLLIKFSTGILSSGASVIYKYFQRNLYQHSFLWLSFTKALQIVIQWLVWLFINFDHLVHQIFFFITNLSIVGNLWKRFYNLFQI